VLVLESALETLAVLGKLVDCWGLRIPVVSR
jgi:hypothetical protein